MTSFLDRAYHWEQRRAGLLVAHVERPPARRSPDLMAMDLFAGAGGFSCGFERAGWHVAAASDWDVLSAETYLANLGSADTVVHVGSAAPPDARKKDRRVFDEHADTAVRAGDLFESAGTSPYAKRRDSPPCEHFWLCDIHELTGEQVLAALGLEVGELGCVIGGPPCQGFSKANAKASANDPRNLLVFEFARLVVALLPKAMLLENVPAMATATTAEGIPIVDALARILDDEDFGVYDAIRRSLLTTSGAGAALRTKRRHEPEPGASEEYDDCTCTPDESSDGSATYEDDPDCPIHGARQLTLEAAAA